MSKYQTEGATEMADAIEGNCRCEDGSCGWCQVYYEGMSGAPMDCPACERENPAGVMIKGPGGVHIPVSERAYYHYPDDNGKGVRCLSSRDLPQHMLEETP